MIDRHTDDRVDATVIDFGIGAAVDEKTDHRKRVVIPTRPDEGGLPERIGGVDLCAVIKEEGGDVFATEHGGEHERCPAGIVGGVYIRPVIDEKLHDRDMTHGGGFHERGATALARESTAVPPPSRRLDPREVIRFRGGDESVMRAGIVGLFAAGENDGEQQWQNEKPAHRGSVHYIGRRLSRYIEETPSLTLPPVYRGRGTGATLLLKKVFGWSRFNGTLAFHENHTSCV